MEACFPLPLVKWVDPSCRIDERVLAPTVSSTSPFMSPRKYRRFSAVYSADVARSIRDRPKLMMNAGIPLSPCSEIDDFAILAIFNPLSDSVTALSKGLTEYALSRILHPDAWITVVAASLHVHDIPESTVCVTRCVWLTPFERENRIQWLVQ